MDENNSYGITVLHEPEDFINLESGLPSIVFDLVAIHGLNGHALETWTHKQSRVMWLRDLLPQAIPNIRIMTYGYNAKFRNFTAQQDIRSISAKLLAELVDLRRTEEETRRPVVFVCHSLGGIIAKKALLLGCPEEQERVQRAVYGVMFLGTPHSGSSIATCGKIFANIVGACSPMNPARTILGVLQKDSEVLFEIMEDFVGKTSKLQLVSFFEMKMTSFGFFKRMVVEHRSAILNVPNEVAIGQNSDHREMARFMSVHDRNFRPVLSRLEKFRQDIVKREDSSMHTGAETQRSIPGDSSTFFEVPISPCSIFCGRVAILNQMEIYFHRSFSEGGGQLTFAICGLGGSGKTQTALQFALRYRFRYKSGVIFLNASSQITLIADFNRIFELLELGHALNRVDAVKRWLSKEENSEWLLIFDNADDLETVWLPRYFPATPWGHIIITSRDQAAIGSVGREGCLLERLEANEAISVLIGKAGIQNPSADDYKQAQGIVELLGCLPLAVDQGGAFVSSRQKTLTDYRRLYEERQHDVLKFKPRLGEYDKTVLTAWEINFEQVERDSKDATDLLLLFCFLEPSGISETMLYRGCSPQKRWDGQGEMEEVCPTDAGLDSGLVALIRNEMDFDAAVDKLLSFSLIRRNNDLNESRSFSVHPLVQHCASQRVPQAVQKKWKLQALLLICHAFPRNGYLEPLYGNLGRSLLAHVHRILKEYDELARESPLPASITRELASLLLAASRFSLTPWKREAITRVKILLQNDTDWYMLAQTAHRESCLSRMLGNLSDSNQTLESFVHSTVLPGLDHGLEADARWNAQRGDLVVSFAENLIQTGDLTAAKQELCEWNPIDTASPSTIERIVLRSKNITMGKVLRFEGRFQDALLYLQEVLRESEGDDFYEGTGWHGVLISNIADLLCELGRPAEAKALLTPELQQMTDRGCQDISNGRRLQLSLVESLIECGMYDEAEKYCFKLSNIYQAIDKPDNLSIRGTFRVWSCLARSFHLRSCWNEALDNWLEALRVLSVLEREEGFQSGIVYSSMSYALFKLGRYQESSESLRKARVMLESKDRKFWIVGFDSYWYDFIRSLCEGM